MEEESTVVLGGGITGLSIAFLKNLKVITDRIETQKNGPLYVHNTPQTRKLVQKLGIPYSTKIVRVGYMYHGSIYSTMSRAMKMEYSMKTRGDVVPTAASCTFEAIDIDFSTVIQALYDEVDIVYDRIKKIYPKAHVLIGRKNRYKYNTLISTIPAPVFATIVAPTMQNDLRGVPLSYIVTTNRNKKLWEWDYIYCVDKDVKAFRIVPLEFPKVELEIPGALPPPWKIIGGKITYPEDILPAGRWARWKDGWMLHHELKEWM